MEASQWICRSCGRGFETRGKRDGHNRKVHQNSGATRQSSVETARMRRSNGGKFVCECKREYESVQALRKHKKKCFAGELMDVDEDGPIEGKSRFLQRLGVKS
jgi:hypothetical protein